MIQIPFDDYISKTNFKKSFGLIVEYLKKNGAEFVGDSEDFFSTVLIDNYENMLDEELSRKEKDCCFVVKFFENLSKMEMFFDESFEESDEENSCATVVIWKKKNSFMIEDYYDNFGDEPLNDDFWEI